MLSMMIMISTLMMMLTCTPLRKTEATVCSASSGHALNQSMVMQVMSEGNCRSRVRIASPTGEKHSTQCRLRFT